MNRNIGYAERITYAELVHVVWQQEYNGTISFVCGLIIHHWTDAYRKRTQTPPTCLRCAVDQRRQ